MTRLTVYHTFFRHKYVLAYLPVVAFYHQARVIYRFKLTETVEELKEMIVKMTGAVQRFAPPPPPNFIMPWYKCIL